MIFCVEDDSGIRELIVYTLRTSGYEAKGLTCAAELFDELKSVRPKLIMLDIMLPGEDGITILKKLRADVATSDIPVIMATAKGTEYDKVIGLDLGADDYLAKPFGMMEMVSRVRAVLRRFEKENGEKILTAGDLSVNTDEHTVFVKGKQIPLTLKEYEILKKLLENPGHVFTRDSLLDTVWGEKYVGETRTVDVHIGTLRTKLGVCGGYIKTVRGVGYKLEAVL